MQCENRRNGSCTGYEAAMDGDTLAQCKVAIECLERRCVIISADEAVEFLGEAAAYGHRQAIIYLADYLLWNMDLWPEERLVRQLIQRLVLGLNEYRGEAGEMERLRLACERLRLSLDEQGLDPDAPEEET